MVQHEHEGGMLANRMTGPEIEREILALRPGDHLCLLYEEDPAEQVAALLPFVRQGLAEGERVIYVTGDSAPDAIRGMLNEYGIDASAAEAAGSFVIWTRQQWPQPGTIDPVTQAAEVRRAIDAALRDGHSGLRFAVEMTWTLDPDVDPSELRHWEHELNHLLAPEPVRMICQYNRSRLSPQAVETALLTHPLAVLGGQVCPNALYEPEEISAGKSRAMDPAAHVDWMLSRLEAVRRFEQQRGHRSPSVRSTDHSEAALRHAADLYEIANRTADSLAQANALKDEFLGLVSHELRTPLTVVLGNADLLLRSEQALDVREREQALEDIRGEALRMNRLVTNLLSVARLSTDTTEHLRPVHLGPLLRRVVAQHLRSYPQRKMTLSVEESEVPCIGIDALIEQIIANLVSNAEKYSTSDLAIEICVRDCDGWRIVAVKDHGIGLDPNDINRAFEAFYRSEQAAGISPGLGIGLTVCKRLVEAQGGRIWARSREGGGAEFCFMLRQAKEEVGAAN